MLDLFMVNVVMFPWQLIFVRVLFNKSVLKKMTENDTPVKVSELIVKM